MEEENDYTFGFGACISCLFGVIITLFVTHIGYPWWFAIVLLLSPLILLFALWILWKLVVLIFIVVDYFIPDVNEDDKFKENRK